MKNLKLALIVCGVLGLAALLVPFSGRSLLVELFTTDRMSAIVYAAIFVLPAAMGAMALSRPPMQAWQSGVALAGCVLGVVRLHVWELALHLPSYGARGALLVAALVIGTVAAVTMLVRPEGWRQAR
ncbi:MAG TPA: hypothetical protein VLM79_08630 [Kofleriaceae bacterium]|nr:hypothetical protein [Kofleriaceae bacterium]